DTLRFCGDPSPTAGSGLTVGAFAMLSSLAQRFPRIVVPFMAEPAGRTAVTLMLVLEIPVRNAVPFMLELPLPARRGGADLPEALVGEALFGDGLCTANDAFAANAPITNT